MTSNNTRRTFVDKKHVENRVKDDTVVFDPDNDQPPGNANCAEELTGDDALEVTTGDAVGSDDEAIVKEIPHDVFSLFYVGTDRMSQSLAVFTFMIQIIIFMQILFDLFATNGNQNENTFHIPPDNTSSVKISQVLACLIAVITQDDFISSVDIHNFSSSKWVISNGMRFVEGVFSLVVSFIFIIQSQRSVDIFLNFVAVTFVSKLDDIVFMLAAGNYFGQKLKILTKEVKECSIPTERRLRFRVHRTAIFLVTLLAMWASLGTILWRQRKNKYVCQSISVQMDDTQNADLGYLSGVYTLQPGRDDNGYPYYRDGNCHDEIASNACGWFTYNEIRKRWAFGREDNEWWDIQSPITASYDILSVPTSEWTAYMGSTNDFQMKCNKCKSALDCGDNGKCQNEICECDDGFFGKFCELTGPCTEMLVADTDVTFGATWAKNYASLRNDTNGIVKAHGRPVFYYDWNDGMADSIDLLYFTGRRWALSSSEDFKDLDGNSTESDLANFFQNKFHAYRSNFSISFISEPTNLGSPANVKWLDWLSDAGTGPGNTHGITKEIEAKLLCADCGWYNICDPDGGTCTVGRTPNQCVCKDNYSGVLCQLNDNNRLLSPTHTNRTKYPTRDL